MLPKTLFVCIAIGSWLGAMLGTLANTTTKPTFGGFLLDWFFGFALTVSIVHLAKFLVDYFHPEA